MSLLLWYPLTKSEIKNQGLADAQPTSTGLTVNANGKLGSCYTFSGNNSYIDTGYKESIGTGDFSITAWFKLSSATTSKTYQPIISNKLTGAASAGIAIYYNHSQNKFLWSTADGSGATEVWTADRFPYADLVDKWNHIVMVRNSSDSKHGYFYINGERVELASVPLVRNVTNSTYSLKIGCLSVYSASYTWTGDLQDIRLYDHALSAKEAKLLSQGLVCHYPLSYPGNENLIKNSYYHSAPWAASVLDYDVEFQGKQCIKIMHNTLYSQTSAGANTIFPSITFKENTQYTLSLLWGEDRTDGKNRSMYLRFKYTDGTYNQIISSTKGADLHYDSMTSAAGKTIEKITTTYGNGGYGVYISEMKLEEGTSATIYSPAPEDMWMTDNIEYDVSGYKYNGVRNNISYSSDSPRYNGSYVLNGTNSWIKCDTNEWMVQGATELTINEWAYAEDWTTQTNAHLFSCTESGGFNTESAGSGYLRFPRHVYTNEAKSSSGYQMSNTAINLADLTPGWHMFTFVYNTSGDKIYIDGELYSSYDVVSYGLHFNTGARLYLGCEANGANPYAPYFSGKLSDFRLYYTELDEDEIKELYNTPISLSSNGSLLTQGEIVES